MRSVIWVFITFKLLDFSQFIIKFLKLFNFILFDQITPLLQKINQFKILKLALKQSNLRFIMLMFILPMLFYYLHQLFLKAFFKGGSVTFSSWLFKMMVIKMLVLLITYFYLNCIVSNGNGLEIKLFIKKHGMMYISKKNHHNEDDAYRKAQHNES